MPVTRVQRFEAQIDKILDDLEGELPIPFKEKVAALYTLVRIQALVNKGGGSAGTGSAVRKYANAFTKENGTRGRKGVARTIAASLDLPDDDDDDEAEPA
jgi:hypothetical protein